MKGCECILEHIVLPPDEVLPRDTGPGEPVHLAYMPVTLLLRDPDASWMLAETSVPSLPEHVSRRGLFQLRPSTVYIRRHISKDQTMYVRRTQFPVMPADVRIVYAAQGSTYPAVVADTQRPPRMSLETHWLACYVMLSRATSPEGFLAMRLAAREELGHRPPTYLVDEITLGVAFEMHRSAKSRDLVAEPVENQKFGNVLVFLQLRANGGPTNSAV